MERESFEDEEVASVLNKHFISIKVDREERPDVDHIYMTFCQALTGSGGWPLTILMTPDRKPFYAGTYFPKRAKWGRPGIIELLEGIAEAWKEERDKLIESADHIMDQMHLDFHPTTEGGDITMEDIHKAFKNYLKTFDDVYGGFGPAPKFPTPHNLSFLLRYWKTTGNKDALKMVEKTLESMYRGGMYDHLGFGFARYSTDRKWLVPHFEKMLYDNALLAIAYLEGYQATGNALYATAASQIFEYVLTDMTSQEGGFFSAEDADSEGEEGKFYVWTPEEIQQVLGAERGKEFCAYYDITSKGNFEGANIPNIIKNAEAFEKIQANPFEAERRKLLEYREKRIHPYKDDKILTSWNGLMIAALSMGARILGNKSYSDAAEKAVKFINDYLTGTDKRLLARYRDGESAYLGYIDDYAFLTWGLIELYEATFKPEYLKQAITFTDDMIKLFYDEKNGGFFMYGSDSESLIVRPKEIYDGATPSGNSVATLNLLRLARMTGRTDLEEIAEQQFKAFGERVSEHPYGHTYFLMSVLFANEKVSEIVIVGEKDRADTRNMIELINRSFLPYSVFINKSKEAEAADLTTMVPYLEGQKMVEDKATAYVCENFACRAPITEIGEFGDVIGGRS